MIFHETGDPAVIVMLTRTLEGGREKCAQYFPLDMESPTLEVSPVESDPFIEQDTASDEVNPLHAVITLLESSYDDSLRSEIRKFELRVGDQSKTVWHYLFAGWTDFMKPEGPDREALIRLVPVTAEKAGSPSNPRVVHCSAGVGRTGTFIALDHLLRGLRSGKLTESASGDPVFDTVNYLREQRMMMVYNDVQYQFIYEVLREQAQLLLGDDIDRQSEGSAASSAPSAEDESPGPEPEALYAATLRGPDMQESAVAQADPDSS
jgi:protein-tyrosine phosphatase